MAVASVASSLALAQGYPDKPLKLIVPYPPGASTDVTARLIGQKVSSLLGQPVVVDNKSGSSGNIGTEFVAKQPADGYTFMLGTDATHAANSYAREYDVERRWRESRIQQIAPISTNLVLAYIAGHVLGTPRSY
ncbi:tripartite tricarboxylate transporter substrate-binding protein [Ottowia sp. VDI28]|uniref:Bug family tripartite tricarboxylate transporter substrate binding protein n=1 Tax=Ottowia sp. VDI28 TaxID=3133968 RepID=UPI003C2D2690